MKIKKFVQEGIRAKKLHIPAKEIILAQNDNSKEIYFIESGEVRIQRRVPELERDVEIAILKGGEFFGELAVMRGRPRNADVVAVTDCELWTMDTNSFKESIRKNPEFALSIVEGLCNKVDNVNQKNEDTYTKFREFTNRFEEISVLWHSLVPY